jgi:hypothetical protein
VARPSQGVGEQISLKHGVMRSGKTQCRGRDQPEHVARQMKVLDRLLVPEAHSHGVEVPPEEGRWGRRGLTETEERTRRVGMADGLAEAGTTQRHGGVPMGRCAGPITRSQGGGVQRQDVRMRSSGNLRAFDNVGDTVDHIVCRMVEVGQSIRLQQVVVFDTGTCIEQHDRFISIQPALF